MIVLDENQNSSATWKTVEEAINDRYSLNISGLIGKGIDAFKENAGNYVLFTLIVIAINVALGLIPILGSLASLVITPPLNAGYIFVAMKIHRGEEVTFNNFFDGFKAPFGNLIILGLVSSILTGLGVLFCILPGIWLAVSWVIAAPMMLFIKSEFWDAMEASRKVIGVNFWGWLGFLIVAGLGALLFSVITCGLGTLIAAPVFSLAIFHAFLQIMEKQS
ncbi:MAG: hypothetical protein ACOYLH_08345 [Flavobacteriales bacterium]|jgi:uncharacterized membrane protein